MIFMKGFLTYYDDHNSKRYMSGINLHWLKVSSPMLNYVYGVILCLISKVWVGIDHCLSYIKMIFDFYLFC